MAENKAKKKSNKKTPNKKNKVNSKNSNKSSKNKKNSNKKKTSKSTQSKKIIATNKINNKSNNSTNLKDVKATNKTNKTSIITIIKEKLKPKKKSNYQKINKYKKGKLIKKIKMYERKIRMYGLLNVIGIKSLVTLTIMFLIILLGIGVILSINKDNNIYDLQSLPESLDQLKTLSYNIDDTENIIEESEAYGNLTDYYTYDFEEEFKLNADYVEEYIIKYNSKSKEVFIVIKPTDEHDQDIKKTFDNFFKSNNIKNYEYLSYQEYQFFIASKNNTLVLSKIKQCQIRVFNPLKELKKADIEETLNISANLYDEALVKEAMLVSQNTGYYIFKSNSKRHLKSIEKLMDKYFSNKEEELKDDETEYRLIKNRVKKINKNYIIYIVSYDNELVMELINE